ncbi:hypothetical protein C8J56DRAFT_1029766, partial [Mycena floridula]
MCPTWKAPVLPGISTLRSLVSLLENSPKRMLGVKSMISFIPATTVLVGKSSGDYPIKGSLGAGLGTATSSQTVILRIGFKLAHSLLFFHNVALYFVCLNSMPAFSNEITYCEYKCLYIPLLGAAAFGITVPSTVVFRSSVSVTWTGVGSDLNLFFLILDFNGNEDPRNILFDPVSTSGESSGLYTIQGSISFTSRNPLNTGGKEPLSTMHIFQVVDVVIPTIPTLSDSEIASQSTFSTLKSFLSDDPGSYTNMGIRTQGNNSSAPGSYVKSQSRKKSIIIGAVLGSVTLFALVAILVLRRSKWVAQVGHFSKEDRGTSRSENPGISLETGQPDQGISPVPSATQLDPRQEVKGMSEPEPQPTVQPSHGRPNTICTISDNVHQSTPVPARMLTLEELMVSSSTPLVELQRMRLEIQGFQDQDQVDLETESKDDEPPAYSVCSPDENHYHGDPAVKDHAA